MECIICGKEFTPIRGNQICCGKECGRIRNSRMCSERGRQYEKIRKPQSKKPILSITEIQKLAEKEGLSYGKYITKYKL